MSLNKKDLRIQVAYMNVLRASGDPDSALKHADLLLGKLTFDRAVPIMNAKAAILRSIDRLQEASALYGRIIDNFPTYTPARFGEAAVRVLRNKNEEARVALPDTNMESETDWYGFRLRALSYVRAGEHDRALPRLSFATGHCPWIRERTKLETALGFAELQKGDADRSIAVLNKHLFELEYRDRQIRLALLGHAHAQKGAMDVAGVMLGRLFTTKDSTLRWVRGSIIAKYNLQLAVPRESSAFVPEQIEVQELSLAMAAN